MSRAPLGSASLTAAQTTRTPRFTFDGFGINDAHDEYCARVATFTKHGLGIVPGAKDLTDRINAHDALLADNARLRAALQAFDAWYDRAASLPVEPNEYAELKTAVRLARAALAESGALPLPQSDKGE